MIAAARLLAGIACVALAPLCVAQNFPAKPIRYVVAFTAGSGADTLARIVVPGMGQVLGQQVIVDNRGGAAGNIGAEFAARAPADGYTLMQAGMPLAANMSLYKNLSYELSRDFSAVSQLVQSPNMLVVHPSLPAKSVKELIALAKARPGAINYSSSGAGSTIYLSFEFFKGMAGINIVHVPYRGGAEAVTAVVSGETSVSFLPLATALPQARQGRLRALAVSTAKRVPSLPEYPTVAEAGVPGYEFGTWYGVMAPPKLPKPLVSKLHGELVKIVKMNDIRDRIYADGAEPVGSEPEVFRQYLLADLAKWARVVKESGAKLD